MFIFGLIKKIIRLTVGLIIICALGLFVAFNIAEASNPVNQNYRKYFLVNKFTRQIFLLNREGDNRYIYLDASKPTILVEVDYQENLEPNLELESWITNSVGTLTGKQVIIKSSHDNEIPDLKSFTDQQIKDVIKVSRNYTPEVDQNYLQVFYLSKSYEQPDLIGKAIGNDAIVIFKDKIHETSTDFAVVTKLERTSLEQQIGFQLGMSLIDRQKCFMSKEINLLNKTTFDIDKVPTNHCSESLVELDDIKKISTKYYVKAIN